jgi:hypothetical protein
MMPGAVLGDIGELKAHAIAYANLGLEVFPLNADKTPRTLSGMKDATTDADRIGAWWDQWPDALIGCRIPPDVVVIDVDPKHNGMTTWKLLKETFGELPLTRSHKSGRNDGGGHLWFQRPPGKLSIRPLNRWAKEHGTGEAAGKHSWVAGVDLLHHGHRYSVLPPSVHPTTGAPYRWVEGRDLAVAPATMPAWLAALITEQPEPAMPAAPRISRVEVDSIADWFSATASWADLLIPEGWTLVAGGGDDDGSKWRHPNATSAWSATIKHGCLFVYSGNTDFDVTTDGDPHGYTRFKALALLGHGGDQSAAARQARYLRDGVTTNGNRADDWGWVGLTSGVGTDTPAPQPAGPAEPDSGLIPIYWPAFWKHEHEGEDWLVEPLIPRGRQVALWAIHKTGKSLITLEVAAAVATGTAVFRQAAGDPADVIYCDMEMTEDDLYDRLTDLGYGPDSPLDRLHYYLLPALPPLDSPEGAAVLFELVARHRAKLVVLDTMARVVAGLENDADTYRAFYRHTGRGLKALGVSLLRLDHGGKDAERGQRGSSAKGDDVDVVWQLTPADNGLELVRKAARMSWVPERAALCRHHDPLHHSLAAADWPVGTRELATLLDTLFVPVDATRTDARAKLTLFNHTASNGLLGKALKYRRLAALDPKDLI